jgi:hypothetical protein
MTTSATATMTINVGLTYRRQVTWPVPGNPSDFTSQLVIRHRYDSATPLLTLNSPGAVVIGGSSGAITTVIRIGADVTATLAPGKYLATMKLQKASDATENWGVSWPVVVQATALVVSP